MEHDDGRGDDAGSSAELEAIQARGPFQYSFEKLEAYQVAAKALAATLKERQSLRNAAGGVSDQLLRALGSVCGNIAEGAGRQTPADRRHSYAIAFASASEAMAHLNMARLLVGPRPGLVETEALLRKAGPLMLGLVRKG